VRNVGYLQAYGYPLPTYHGPPWPQPVAEEPVTEAEVAAWRERWQATCSDRVARLLCALERDYGAIRLSGDAR